MGARAVWASRVWWWACIVWIWAVPGVELVWRQHSPDVPRALRGWHMFRDVGGDACVLGLVDEAGRRVYGDDVSDDARAAFDRVAIAGAPIDGDGSDVGVLCAHTPPLSPAYFCRDDSNAGHHVDVGDAFRCPP